MGLVEPGYGSLFVFDVEIAGRHIGKGWEGQRAAEIFHLVARFHQRGERLFGPMRTALHIDRHISILLYTGSARDKTPDDHVLLQTDKLILLAANCRFR